MSVKRLRQRRYSRFRKKVLVLLPDTCQIKPTADSAKSYQKTPSGLPLTVRGNDESNYREWTDPDGNVITQIPCRMDMMKFIRYEDVYGQEAVPNQYEMYIPYDAPVESGDIILYEGREYAVLSMHDTGKILGTKFLLVSDVRSNDQY